MDQIFQSNFWENNNHILIVSINILKYYSVLIIKINSGLIIKM